MSFIAEECMPKAYRGFAVIKDKNPDLFRELSSKGGVAVHEKGTGNEWTQEEAREAGRKGGRSTARRRRQARRKSKERT